VITHKSTPARDRFWMPGEFEPHAGCWMLWPERPDNWREEAAPARVAFVAVARAIARFEPVTVGASARQFEAARASLPAGVRVVELSSDDCWMRDVGPTFVVNAQGELRGVDWQFNAWGGALDGLYASWEQDQLVARKVLEVERCGRYAAPFVNEGGAIHVDGQGTLLVTEQCNLNPNRNPHLSKPQVESLLRRYLGVSTVVWLGQGVYEDETGGHIDNLACFARPGEVCLAWCDDPRDPQHRISVDAYERLMDSRDARGRRFKVHKLPVPRQLRMTAREARGVRAVPGTRARAAGARLAASYVNFYIANGGIVVPLLDPASDRAALARLRRVFPRHRVVGVPGREILLGGGNIHCITQQVPLAGRPRTPPAGLPHA
jgi:agmatine deiminase